MNSFPIEIEEFLLNNPFMSICPTNTKNIVIKGEYSFDINLHDSDHIIDKYKIKIIIYNDFPHRLPKVFELENKIPKNSDFHVNWDHSLCLGSTLKILSSLKKNPDLNFFAEKFLLPYLYDTSRILKDNTKKRFFGELSHGVKGLIEDYKEVFDLKNKNQVLNTIDLLTLPYNLAKESKCSCGCGRKLKNCVLNDKIKEFKGYADESWYKSHLKNMLGE
ncbi:MAG: hypothetical protein ACOCRX_12555 [Candidatus Woesearchaeota archaeon]